MYGLCRSQYWFVAAEGGYNVDRGKLGLFHTRYIQTVFIQCNGAAKRKVQFSKVGTTRVLAVGFREETQFLENTGVLSSATFFFLKMAVSFVAIQRAFRLHFNLACHDPVPQRGPTASRTRTLDEPGSTVKLKGFGRPNTVKTPTNSTRLREAIEHSPTRSARRKPAIVSGISD